MRRNRRSSSNCRRTASDGPIVIYRKVYLNETLPELGSRLYDKVDYELKLRTLTRDIRVAEVELAQQRERLRVYDNYFGYTDAGLLTLQNAKLDVVKSEEQLKLLHQAKLLALRHRNDQIRYRKLLLDRNAASRSTRRVISLHPATTGFSIACLPLKGYAHVAKVNTFSPLGIEARSVEVEVGVLPGVISVAGLVGLPEAG